MTETASLKQKITTIGGHLGRQAAGISPGEKITVMIPDGLAEKKRWKCEHGTVYNYHSSSNLWYCQRFGEIQGIAKELYVGCSCRPPCSPGPNVALKYLERFEDHLEGILDYCECGSGEFEAVHAGAGNGATVSLQCASCGSTRSFVLNHAKRREKLEAEKRAKRVERDMKLENLLSKITIGKELVVKWRDEATRLETNRESYIQERVKQLTERVTNDYNWDLRRTREKLEMEERELERNKKELQSLPGFQRRLLP